MVVMKQMSPETIRQSLQPLKPIPADLKAAGRLPCRPEAVLFDVYGTLLVSGSGDISLAASQGDSKGISGILARCGIPVSRPDETERRIPEYLEHFIRVEHENARDTGVDFPEVEIREIWQRVLKQLWDEGLLSGRPEALNIEDIALAHEISVNPIWPMPGFPELPERLARENLRIGIVSNAQFYTAPVMEALTRRSLQDIGFEEQLCSWSYRLRRAKPSPLMFEGPLKILRDSGIEAGKVLYVGNDMLNDVATGARAGCMTVLFAGDRRSLRLRESDPGADRTPDARISELDQLITLVNGGSLDGQG